ncbi:hypothetical protein HHK36_000991 [Tetracentron sinense]|uniref:Uncharacterized protein n=1 Tax=Tetracentron sinense TaxID=13715 RepID=A0A835A2U2_TETSI|nr:hypothetical protein HHK36_000991 [Tetracentron sinense]
MERTYSKSRSIPFSNPAAAARARSLVQVQDDLTAPVKITEEASDSFMHAPLGFGSGGHSSVGHSSVGRAPLLQLGSCDYGLDEADVTLCHLMSVDHARETELVHFVQELLVLLADFYSRSLFASPHLLHKRRLLSGGNGIHANVDNTIIHSEKNGLSCITWLAIYKLSQLILDYSLIYNILGGLARGTTNPDRSGVGSGFLADNATFECCKFNYIGSCVNGVDDGPDGACPKGCHQNYCKGGVCDAGYCSCFCN